MEIINKELYHKLLYHYMMACWQQKSVREHTEAFMKILGDNNQVAGDNIVDSLYAPDAIGSDDELKELLLKQGLQIDLITVKKLEHESEENNSAIRKTKTKKI